MPTTTTIGDRWSATVATATLAALLAIVAGLLLLGAPAADAASSYAHLGTFSGPGSADGEMVAPRRVAVDAAGNVLVVDSGNDRIQVFSPTSGGGSYLTQFGGGGTLNDPYGIAVDRASGAVYVSDAGNSRIVRFTSNGLPVPSYTLDLTYPSPAQGGGTGQVSSFASPIALVPGSGNLVVADTGSQTVKRFNPDGSYDGLTFDGADSGLGAFADLLDLAVDSTGDVIVVHSLDAPGDYPYVLARGRVSRFSSAGVFEASVAPANTIPGAVAVNSVDQVLITDNQYSYTTDNPLNLRLYSPSNELVSTTPLPGGSLWSRVHGLATGPGADGRAYVVTDQVDGVWGLLGRVAVEAFEPVNPIPPDAVVSPASAVTTNSATLNGTVDPNAKATSYHFDYRTGNTGSWTSTPDGDAGDGDTPVAVTADVAGLTPNTTYQFRLVATSADGTTTSPVESFTTAKTPPATSTLDASQVKDSSAWLHGEVNPNGEPTRYWFEYGTTTSYGSRVPVDQDASAGQGVAVKPVAHVLYDLEPNTTYHYRIVAENPTGRVEGTDRTFTTKIPSGGACPNEAVRRQQGSVRLPDCRAYEQVSPLRKHGYEVGNNGSIPYVELGVDSSGDRASFVGFYPLPGVEAGSMQGLQVNRAADGWTATGVLPRPGPVNYGGGIPGAAMVVRGVSADQKVTAYWNNTSELAGSLGIRRADGSHIRLANAVPGPTGVVSCPTGNLLFGSCPPQAWFEGMSDDGRRIVFVSAERRGPAVGLPGTSNIIYEWVDDSTHPDGGALRVVNRTDAPSLALLDSGAPAGLGGSTSDDQGWNVGARGLRNAISNASDGHTRIFFQNPAPASQQALIAGPIYMREDGQRTVELSRPEDGNPDTTSRRYLDASEDGTRVFFWADGKLTDDAVPGGGIYRYDIAPDGAGDLTFLTTAPAVEAAPPGAMASDDGSRIYYQKGIDVHVVDDEGDRLVLADATVGSDDLLNHSPRFGDSVCPSINLSAGDGRYAAFQATKSGAQMGVYRYDAQAGVARIVAPGVAAGFTPFCSTTGYPRELSTRVMSDDGRFVFFSTRSPLTPEDTNGQIDTYRWHDGTVRLISSGTGPAASAFLGTDASGANAFFATRDPLARQDGDEGFDIYTARVGGGFTVDQRQECSGDGCQGAPMPPPASSAIGSAGVGGSGNVASRVNASVVVSKLRAVIGSSATLKVRVPGAGRIAVAGSAIRRISRSASKAGTYSVKVRLRSRAKESLKERQRLKVNVLVSYRTRDGRSASKTIAVTFKRPATKRAKGRGK